MKILHIAYSLSEQSAAFRLAEEQSVNQGDQIYFLLARKSTSSFVESRRIFPFLTSFIGFTAHLIDYIAKKCFVRTDEVFSIGINLPAKNWIFEKLIHGVKPDIVHIHWGGYSFIPTNFLNKISKFKDIRLIVTTHDYNYFTGGCHIPMACPEHSKNCRNCPMANNKIGKNWIRKNRSRNNKILSNTKITFVAPSFYTNNYLNNNFKGIRSKIISNTAGNFYLLVREALKSLYLDYLKYRVMNNNIPTIIAVGTKITEQQNKGADIILELVKKMKQQKIPFNIITVGEFVQLDIIGTHLHFANRSIDQMKQLYTIADICIVPSRYETFSQVTLESIQLGTPVVAFDLTGPKDIIKNDHSGFLVPSFNIDQFSTTVIENLNYKFNNEEKVFELALNTFDEFSPNNIAAKYKELYLEKIID